MFYAAVTVSRTTEYTFTNSICVLLLVAGEKHTATALLILLFSATSAKAKLVWVIINKSD